MRCDSLFTLYDPARGLSNDPDAEGPKMTRGIALAVVAGVVPGALGGPILPIFRPHHAPPGDAVIRAPMGTANNLSVPNQVFPTADGSVVIIVPASAPFPPP